MDERPEEQMSRQRPSSQGPEDMRRLSSDRGEVAPDPSGTQDELEKTRLELAQTRAQMSETMEVIQGRMNSDYVKEQARDRIRSSARRSGSSIADGVKRNPVPLALVGAGLGWLLVNAGSSAAAPRDSKESGGAYASGQRELEGRAYGSSYARDYSYGRQPGTGERDVPRRAGSPTGGVARGSGSNTNQEEGSARGEQAQQKAQEAQQQAQQRAQEGAQKAKGGFQKALQESPLALGAAAIGLGVAVGLSIPESEKENQMMGETRDRLKDQAEHKAQDAKERGKRVAEQAQQAAKDEASDQDLTS